MAARQPSFFIPHGGGPCFFMPDPAGYWVGMGAFLRSLHTMLPERPAAILLVSAHWETRGFRLTGGSAPTLIFDYYGFPPETYDIRYGAPGSPDLASRAAGLLLEAGLPAALDDERGFDHGVFIPMKVAFPDADIPIVEMSLERDLDPAMHLSAGRALSRLRDEGVLILGSGMSFHDLKGFGDARYTIPSKAFDQWLSSAVAQPGEARTEILAQWEGAPSSRTAHPTAEHLLPLMVAAGASEAPGERIYSELVLQTAISAFCFD